MSLCYWIHLLHKVNISNFSIIINLFRGWCQFELSLSGTRYMNLASLPEDQFATLSSSPLLVLCPLAHEKNTWDLYNSVIVPMTQGKQGRSNLTPDEVAILETIMDASFTKAAFSFESDRSFV